MSSESMSVLSRRDRIVRAWQTLPRPLRVLMAATTGSGLVVVGIALLVLPGPGVVVIALGLGVLATEFAWARRVLHRGRHHAGRAVNHAASLRRRGRSERAPVGQQEAPEPAAEHD